MNNQSEKHYRKSIPAGWRLGYDEALVCPHRDLSVCAACASGKHAHQIVHVYGVHYWAADPMEHWYLTTATNMDGK